MTNYSENSGSVRVEFFKPNGKWYMTEAWDMSNYYNDGPTPIDAVRNMFHVAGKTSMLDRYIAVVLEPYHNIAYPVMLVPGVMVSAHPNYDMQTHGG